MNEAVRTCRIDDAEQLCGLIRNELGYADITVDNVRSSLKKILSNNDYFTFVAEDNSGICGFISAVREFSLEIGEYCRVLALAVKKEYQGIGIGTALITLVESNARAEGAKLITLSSQFMRTAAHEFYEKLGYEKTSFTFKKKFG